MTNTRTSAAAQAVAPKARTPKATDASALSVCDGTDCVGHLVEHGGKFFAFDLTDKLIGKFATQREAMCAIPPLTTDTQ